MKKLASIALVILFVCFSGNGIAKSEGTLKENFRFKNVVQPKKQDLLTPANIETIKIEGEIGRRIDVTINNNIKNLHLDKNFTNHFQTKTGPDVVGGFVGMGMLIDACVRFAAYSHDPDMLEIKNQIVKKIIDAQLEDGYSGFYKPGRRLWNLEGGGDNWDIHEMAFIIDGQTSDYQFFGNKASLESAIKTADFILARWHEMPDDYAAEVDMHVLDTEN